MTMDILIIQVLRMGDALQLFPVIGGIKEVFPDAHIHLLTSRLGAEVFRANSEVEKTFILDKEKIVSLVLCGEKEAFVQALDILEADLSPLINRRWDWVINLGFTFSSALLSFLLDSKHRSGLSVNEHRQYLSKDKWFHFSLASFMNRRYSNFNWIDIYKRIAGLDSVPRPPYFKPNMAPCARAADTILRFEGSGPIVGIHPGAGGDFKQWPVENFGKLGRMLADKNGCRLLIFGSSSEKELCSRLHAMIGGNAENLAGQTSVEELAALLSRCEVLISNDTGPMHLASSVGTRVIALFFSTHFAETGPYGAGHIAVHPDISCFPCQGTAKCVQKSCLSLISPEAVKKIFDIANPSIRQGGPLHGINGLKGIKVFQSAFDPWGYLDWFPGGRPLLTLPVLEKLLLRIAWLIHSGVTDSSDRNLEAYVSSFLACYSKTDRLSPVVEGFDRWVERMAEYKGLLEKARNQVLDLQTELIKIRPDSGASKKLSGLLNASEDEIGAFGSGDCFSFLDELLTVFCENIEKTDPLNLSTRTAEAYRDILFIVTTILKQVPLLKSYMH
ncbi:MAG: glycosyltransferase family 9 protein [Desulfobacteraceae bacterium]|nr:MAG: glycosyltransferase family 9 protein [Desulfobacteraceae bacterium]